VVFTRLPQGSSEIIQIPASDSQRRLEEILADPEGYFTRARARAWAQATDEVNAELAARARPKGHHVVGEDLTGDPRATSR
jgi:hypothetical protein